MEDKNHYLTYAVYFVKDANYGEVPYCSVDYGELEGNAQVRKLCFCGSDISYDEDQAIWVCSSSGETICSASEQTDTVLAKTARPLTEVTPMAIETDLYMNDMRHPEQDSLVAIDKTNQMYVFVKIPSRKLWTITDPLPISNWFSIKPMNSDLMVEWSLEIGADLPGSIDVTISLSVLDKTHKEFLEILASQAGACLYFVEKESLSLVACRPIFPNAFYLFVVRQAFELASRLPDNPDARETVLRDFTEEQKWSMMTGLNKLGLFPCTKFWMFLFNKGSVEEFGAHRISCDLCRNMFSSSEEI